MSTGTLTIDLDALVANWRALAALSPGAEAAAVVKADGYGLEAARVAAALAAAGAQRFFVAVAEEGAALRRALGPGPEILVLGGHMAGDTALIADAGLIPMLNSPEQIARHRQALDGAPFGIQFDTGMNRLGIEAADWQTISAEVLAAGPRLLMSHLACGDEPDHPANAAQLAEFHRLTDGTGVARSLAATAGILLGRDYHFDLTRPGVGMYGGAPFEAARPVVRLSLPVIQTRTVRAGEFVGYGATFVAQTDRRIATVSGGYADGLIRAMGPKGRLWAGDHPCPIAGRVSMDLITVDVTDLPQAPETLDILGPHQGVDALAAMAGTIGYEILTSLSRRYARTYVGGAG